MVHGGKLVKQFGPHDFFGELEMMYQQPKTGDLVVTSDTLKTFALDRNAYRQLMTGTFIRKRRMYEGFLKKVDFLRCMSHKELLHLADALEPQSVGAGGYLIRYGETGQWMYIVIEGVVEVIGRDEGGTEVDVCEFGRGDCVGELEFIYDHLTAADVRAKTDVRAAKLNRQHFELCMGPVVDVLKRNAGEENKVYDYYNSAKKVPRDSSLSSLSLSMSASR